jgi:CRISPR/Cas system CSM-associated protein Csm5 (group 7 of RAMP superfamily)
MFVQKKILIFIIILFLSASSKVHSQESQELDKSISNDIAQCTNETDIFKKISCLVSLAKKYKNVDICDKTTNEGVRFQCYAIYAEHSKDWEVCKLIPNKNAEYQSLISGCISDVASVLENYELCENIQTTGIKDSCYLKIFRKTKNYKLCEKIKDPGLKSACTGKPVFIE